MLKIQLHTRMLPLRTTDTFGLRAMRGQRVGATAEIGTAQAVPSLVTVRRSSS